ncbi:RCC1/BLIP-II [Trametes versicolor FP-101664 SS1]|uniref:RCC1/BLIP-II n=1 Tax=Trametes versicolor (strain FP-101664) TaxID=717944 RepID=UPI0004622A8F|nr:RCC1/BLIP-II [Trametes versicolor FP-101664 SS1]EIW60539.1 RCC1/BLIP-II [Trametes versicolor FP-101664 SS1]
MLRGTTRVVAFSRVPGRRYLSYAGRTSQHTRSAVVLTSVSAAAAGALWHATNARDVIHNDAPSTPEVRARGASDGRTQNADAELTTLVWGANKTHILEGDLPESVRVPTPSEWFDNVALRDLALHEQHAACVDARGDLYQWGDGFFGSEPGSSRTKPRVTLRGKNITQLQLTRSRVFALSASGRVYVLSSRQAEQALPAGAPTPASTPWWGTGWLWGEEEEVNFAEITPNEGLKRGERFVQISAGTDHMLAVTSEGRTFAHPITLNANSHGQLGFRKCDVPSPIDLEHFHLPHKHPRIPLELTPKSIADPYAKASPAIRPSSSLARSSEALVGKEAVAAGLDDANIRFSDKLFEVPALKGVNVDRVATGGRSSFVKTAAGKVLGWGANEFGQIGLGGNVTLETITVPTEVILWRATPATMRTTCVDVFAGGDLTMFEVERSDGSGMPYIDVLACGNGQYGGLGNAMYSNSQGTPVRAKNVSGLYEYSERTQNLQAIAPERISISPTGHVLLTLDTRKHSGPGGGGKDVVVWGANFEYQLGNGKRGSLPTPTTLLTPEGERFMLQHKRATAVRDLQGQVWKKGVEVEQRAVAGWNSSVVYWRICP